MEKAADGRNRIMKELLRRWPQRLLLCALSFLACFFLAIRTKGFCIQWLNVDIPITALLPVAAVLALAAFLFGIPWGVERYRLHGVGCGCVLFASSVFAYLGRGILCVRAIENTQITMGTVTQAVYILGSGVLLGFFLLFLLPALGRGAKAFGRLLQRFDRYDLLLLGGMVLLVNLLTWWYASASETVYFWDNAGYWKTAQTLGALWRDSGFFTLLKETYDSILTLDYNYLIALPAALLYRLFGGSRLVFLLSIVNFGYVFFGFILLCICKENCKQPRLTAAAVILSFPMLFYHVLIGFVDVAGCGFTMLAYGLYLRDGGKNRLDIFLLAGVCLALAILLRRWFSFFAVSFVLMLLLDCTLFRRSAMPVLGTAGALVFLLGYFFQPFVSGKMLADYRSMYAAYLIGLDKDFLLLFRYYGIALLLLLMVSALLLRREKGTRRTFLFVFGQTTLCFLMFVRVQTHGQQHMLLYAAPLAIAALLSADRLAGRPTGKTVVWLLSISLLHTLSPLLPRLQPANLEALTKPALLPSFSWNAPKNPNAETYVELIRRLDELGADGSTVGIAAASLELNADLLCNTLASLSLPGGDVQRSYLRTLPEVDQRDGWKDTVFSCDYLLTADPVQVHLGENNEQGIALPARALLGQTGMGCAFEKLDDRWTLASGAEIYLYRRVRDVTEEEKAELRTQFAAAHSGG